MQSPRPVRLLSVSALARVGVAALAAALLVVAPATSVRAQQATPPLEQLRNATYPSPHRASKSITLTGGKFDSVAERVNMTFVDATFGTLNGTPVAVVHTATNTGGSGVFSEIYIVDATLKPFGPGFLGDRLKDVRVQIVDNRIHVDMITQGPTEPLCCPTTPARQTWELVGGTLTRTSMQFAQVQPVPVRPAATGNAGTAGDGGDGGVPMAEALLLALGLAGLVVLARHGQTPVPGPAGSPSRKM